MTSARNVRGLFGISASVLLCSLMLSCTSESLASDPLIARLDVSTLMTQIENEVGYPLEASISSQLALVRQGPSQLTASASLVLAEDRFNALERVLDRHVEEWLLKAGASIYGGGRHGESPRHTSFSYRSAGAQGVVNLLWVSGRGPHRTLVLIATEP